MIERGGRFISSTSAVRNVVNVPPREASRIVTLSAVCSTSKPVNVVPSTVWIVTVSYPLRITFDGSNTDSTIISSVTSPPILVKSGPSADALGSPTAWHLEQAM